MPIQSQNPATKKIIKTFKPLSPSSLRAKIAKGEAAYQSWRHQPISQRTRAASNLATTLRKNAQTYAKLITLEMGKPITDSMAEIEKCALTAEYYATNSARFFKPKPVATDAGSSYIRFDPLGLILAVMPWNFPFWQAIRAAVPALTAGNGLLLKHASNTPQSALAIESAFNQAGYPPHLFQTLLISTQSLPLLLGDDRVKAATLTGSEAAGSSFASLAGKNLKKVVLELGGSDPTIILPDANLDIACDIAVRSRFINSGQSCIATKRFIIVKDILKPATAKIKANIAALKVGDPLDPTTQIGPLSSRQILEEVDSQVKRSLKAGAKLLLGGHHLSRPGYFYAPTLLTNVNPQNPAFFEETFGPIGAITSADNLDHAIELANDSPYGLGAAIHTKNTKLAEKLAQNLEVGSVFINGLVKSDPRLPFGGVKRSGYGRELAEFGQKEFVNVKTVWIK